MELHYNVEMFQELAELIENVKYEIRKKFKLRESYQIGLKTTGTLA